MLIIIVSSHPGFRQLFNLLDLVVRQDVQVADDVRTVPLVLFLHGLQQETRVPVSIVVTTEQTTASLFILGK